MNSEVQQPVSTLDAPVYSVPWKFRDNWIAVGLLALVMIGIAMIMLRFRTQVAQSAAILLLESAYLLPVILILAWRRIHWKHLGFGKFEWSTLGIGCGLLIASYAIILVHNLLLIALGVDTQGEQIMQLFAELDAPVWFFVVGAVFAPFVEEVFFRGFLFQGLRQRHGWVAAMLISSAIFAIGHLDLASLIPTFVLGNLLAYVYHRSNSVWPGIILHFLVNTSSLCAVYFVTQYPNLIPS
jgi:uncharacterized protein